MEVTEVIESSQYISKSLYFVVVQFQEIEVKSQEIMTRIKVFLEQTQQIKGCTLNVNTAEVFIFITVYL